MAAIAAALGLSACGRKSGLDLPPSAAATPPAVATPAVANPPGPVRSTANEPNPVSGGFDSRGNPVAPAGEKKSFFLDPLLQ